MLPLQRMTLVSEKVSLAQSGQKAHTALIPKEEHDPMPPQSYKPILLLNGDYKLFTSIMAQKLKKCIPKIIHYEQTGLSQRDTEKMFVL